MSLFTFGVPVVRKIWVMICALVSYSQRYTRCPVCNTLHFFCHVAAIFTKKDQKRFTKTCRGPLLTLTMKSLLYLVGSLYLFDVILLVSSLSFTLPSGAKKCLKEEVHKDVLVTGEYRLSEAPHQKTHLKVR